MELFWVLLTILFIALKLTGFIYWSWWLVLLPVYFSLLLYFGVLIIALIAFFIGGTIKLLKTVLNIIFS
jgi:hypothetical protein